MRAAETFGMRGKKMQTELRVCAAAARLFAAGLGKNTLIPLQNGEVGVQGEHHGCICAYHSNYTASSLNKQAVHIINIPQTPFYSCCRVINKLQVGTRSCCGKTRHLRFSHRHWPRIEGQRRSQDPNESRINKGQVKLKARHALKMKGSMRSRRKPR